MRRPPILDRVKFPARCPNCQARFDINLSAGAREHLCPSCERYFLPDQRSVLAAAKCFAVLYRYLD